MPVRACVRVCVLVGGCVCVCVSVSFYIDDLYRVVIDSVISVLRKPSVVSDSLVCLVVQHMLVIINCYVSMMCLVYI